MSEVGVEQSKDKKIGVSLRAGDETVGELHKYKIIGYHGFVNEGERYFLYFPKMNTLEEAQTWLDKAERFFGYQMSRIKLMVPFAKKDDPDSDKFLLSVMVFTEEDSNGHKAELTYLCPSDVYLLCDNSEGSVGNTFPCRFGDSSEVLMLAMDVVDFNGVEFNSSRDYLRVN